jgi:hypothetical protein
MRRYLTVFLMASSILLVDAADEAFAKGGRGRGGASRGGGRRSVNRAPRTRQFRHRTHDLRPSRPHEPGEYAGHGRDHSGHHADHGGGHGLEEGTGRPPHERFTRDHSLSGREHALARQRFNEERKLQHRNYVANHLREVGERNGNQNLLDTADRMEQKAQEHYDKRMARIEQQADTPEAGDPTDPGTVPDGTEPVSLEDGSTERDGSTAPGDGTSTTPEGDLPHDRGKLHGRQNALERHYRNAQRQLEHHFQRAQTMRETGAGDPDRLAAADRIEQQALQDFERRMDQMYDFADRFGLSVPGTETSVQ